MKRKEQDDRLSKPLGNNQAEFDSKFDDEKQIDDDMSWYEDLIYDQWRENQIIKDLPQR